VWEWAQLHVTSTLGEDRFRHLLADLSEIIALTNPIIDREGMER
jgi:hypothetical protein